jgi:hypothetical protein
MLLNPPQPTIADELEFSKLSRTPMATVAAPVRHYLLDALARLADPSVGFQQGLILGFEALSFEVLKA